MKNAPDNQFQGGKYGPLIKKLQIQQNPSTFYDIKSIRTNIQGIVILVSPGFLKLRLSTLI